MFLLTESVLLRWRIARPGAPWLSLDSPLRLPAAAQRPQSLAEASPSQDGPELEQIVGGTDQCPFPADIPQAAQQELPEPAGRARPCRWRSGGMNGSQPSVVIAATVASLRIPSQAGH